MVYLNLRQSCPELIDQHLDVIASTLCPDGLGSAWATVSPALGFFAENGDQVVLSAAINISTAQRRGEEHTAYTNPAYPRGGEIEKVVLGRDVLPAGGMIEEHRHSKTRSNAQ